MPDIPSLKKQIPLKDAARKGLARLNHKLSTIEPDNVIYVA